MSRSASRIAGTCRRKSSAPPPNAMTSGLYRLAAISARLPAPTACAVSPVVPMRRKPKAQNSIENTVEPRATPPISAGSLSCPTTAVSAMPTSGTVAFETIMGMAMASTSRLVTSLPCTCVFCKNPWSYFGRRGEK